MISEEAKEAIDLVADNMEDHIRSLYVQKVMKYAPGYIPKGPSISTRLSRLTTEEIIEVYVALRERYEELTKELT